MKFLAAAVLAAAFAVSCSKEDTTASATPDAADAGTTTEEPSFGGDRPATVRVPPGYDPAKPAPLLVVLHGYGAGGVVMDALVGMGRVAEEKGAFYVAPDGSRDAQGKLFWNATDACCDFGRTGVDDVAYITGLVREIQAAYAIDPKRIYVMGHSNGGFMANRLACDRADVFAAAVSFAGANWSDPSRCAASEPIGFLQIHGTKDGTIAFKGSVVSGLGAYPGAETTVATWAQKNGCAAAAAQTGTTLKVNANSPAPDAPVARHDGCARNGAAELWAVEGAPHIFVFSTEASNAAWSFLEAHAKP